MELPENPKLREFFLRCERLISDSLLRILRCDITCRRILRMYSIDMTNDMTNDITNDMRKVEIGN